MDDIKEQKQQQVAEVESQPKAENPATTEMEILQKDDSSKTNEIAVIKGETKYVESPYRYAIVVSYFLLCFANGFQWVTFSSCAENFGKAYNLESWKVNMFSLIYMIAYPFVCIPEGYLIDNYSARVGLIISAVLTLLAAGLKCLVNQSMACVFIGQVCAAIFQPAILNSPGKIAANWFRENVRTLVTTICCISNTIGILFGFVFHTFFIDDEADGQDYKDQFFNYIIGEWILNVVFCLPTIFLMRDKPATPPSPSQELAEKPPLGESLRLLFTNSRFIYLLISTCFTVGYYCVYGTILNAYLSLYNIADSQASYIYAVSSAVGIISSLIVSAMLDKYKKFKLFMVVLAIVGLIFQILFTWLLEIGLKKGFNQYAVGMVMYSLVNAVIIPFYTIGMNYACEITYPVGESISGGLMMTMSQLSGIAGTFGCDELIIKYSEYKYASNIVLIGFFVIAVIFVLLFDEKLIRNDIDAQGLANIAKPNSNENKESDVEFKVIVNLQSKGGLQTPL